MDLKHSDVWNGEYRGVHYRIYKDHHTRQSFGEHPWWYAEILLYSLQFSDSVVRRFLFSPGKMMKMSESGNKYPSFERPKLPFHMDTWRIERAHVPRANPLLVVGWDYQHIWNDNMYVDESIVQYEIHEAIDNLHHIYHLRMRCTWCGKWDDPNRMIMPENEYLRPIHPKCKKKQEM